MKAIDKAKERQAAENLISMIENSKEYADLKAASSDWLTVNLYIKGQHIDWKTELRSSLEWMEDKHAETTDTADSDDEEDSIPEEEDEYPTHDDYEAQSWAWCPNDDYRDKDWDEALGDALDDGCPIEDTEDTPSSVSLSERQEYAFMECVKALKKDPKYIMAWEAGFIGKGLISFNSPFYGATVELSNPTNIAPCECDLPDEKIKVLYNDISVVFYCLTADYNLQDNMSIGDRIILEFKGKKDYVCEFNMKAFSNVEVTKILEHWDLVSDGNSDWLDKARSRFREDMFHKFIAVLQNTDEYGTYMACPDSGRLTIEYIGMKGTISETFGKEISEIYMAKRYDIGNFKERRDSADKFDKLKAKIMHGIPELEYLRNVMDYRDEIQMFFEIPEGHRYVVIPKEDQED